MIDLQRVFFLTKWLDDVLDKEAVGFGSLTPSAIPEGGGVYLISDSSHGKEEIVYVGLTGNLRQRIYVGQLMGNKVASPVKSALVEHGRAKEMASAKEHMKEHCAVRFDVVPDYREREMREGFAKAVLKPQFSLYKSKEH